MSIKNYPVYFHFPGNGALAHQVNQLNSEQRSVLEGAVYASATREGVSIAEWDREWGKHHLYDSDPRLIGAMLTERKLFLQKEARCSERVAALLIWQCPLVDRPDIPAAVTCDLIQRAKCIDHLEKLQEGLHQKYPALGNETRTRAWKNLETFFLLFPVPLGKGEIERYRYLSSVVQEVITGKYDGVTAGIILDRLFARESMRPTSPDLQDHLRLLVLKRLATEQIARGTLVWAQESSYKAIYVVPSPQDKQAKFKPLHPRNGAKEVYAYRCDRALGLGMTAPTMGLSAHFVPHLLTLQQLFRAAALGGPEAKSLRQRAIAQLKAAAIPEEVRNGIFGEMYALCGERRQVDALGEKLMLHLEGYLAPDRFKALAIDNYRRSEAFSDHVRRLQSEGSVQIWQQQCTAGAFDYLVSDPNGGQKLGRAPKALVHCYAVLGMLKGSMDCSSNNTLVEFNEETGRVVNFWDMDDERSMPEDQNFMQIRLWQLGLPQCAQPFDRAFLMLFSDTAIIDKLQRMQRSPQIASTAYKMQLQRAHALVKMCRAELSRGEITLTPRDLYFALFPGSREEFQKMPQLPPVELFEFHMNEMGRFHIGQVGGREACYSKVGRQISREEFEAERRRIDTNMRVLQDSIP